MNAERIANNWDLWRKYVDPKGSITKQPAVWLAMPFEQRLALAREALELNE